MRGIIHVLNFVNHDYCFFFWVYPNFPNGFYVVIAICYTWVMRFIAT